MRAWPAVLISTLLAGQEAGPVGNPSPPAPRLKVQKPSLTPQAMLRAMLAREQAQRNQPGATVAVIGYDDEAALRLLAFTAARKVGLEYKPFTDSLHAKELGAFMQQDPSHPSPVLILPVLAGGPSARAEDKWLR